MNNIRFFYADPEIDKAIERPIIRLNPMTLMFLGVSDDNKHLYQSATYLRNEMPIRLAHFVKELRSLPFIVASAWHMKIGMQVVIEDYVHHEQLKLAAIIANNFFSFAVALASIYAILKLSSGV